MEISDEQYQRICRFLDADMTIGEMEIFEMELETNSAMRKQLDFEQSMRNNFISFHSTLKTDVEKNKTESANYTSEARNLKRRIKWVFIAAAAAVTGILITIAIKDSGKKSAPVIVQTKGTLLDKKKDTSLYVKADVAENDTAKFVALYNQYFEADTLPQRYPMYLAEAFREYENGGYTALQKLNLDKIPDFRGTDNKNGEIAELGHYYKGIAFLKTNNIKSGIANLQWLEKNCSNNLLKEKAQWYLALGYLRTDNLPLATKSLQRLSEKSIYSRYKNKARTLLKALQE